MPLRRLLAIFRLQSSISVCVFFFLNDPPPPEFSPLPLPDALPIGRGAGSSVRRRSSGARASSLHRAPPSSARIKSPAAMDGGLYNVIESRQDDVGARWRHEEIGRAHV